MGGAGLALPIDIAQNHRLNPAMLAFGRKGFQLQYPTLGYRLEGIGFGDIKKLTDTSGSGLDDDQLIDVARTLADERIDVGFDGAIGVMLSGLSLSANGEAAVAAIPNSVLSSFVQSGRTDYQTAPELANARLDAYGYGFYSMNAGYGNAVQIPMGRLAIGGTLKRVRSFYTHKVADEASIRNNTAVRNGAEFGSSLDDVAEKTSTGFDLGLIFSPEQASNTYFGLTVQNLIRPKVDFRRTLPGSDDLSTNARVDPFKTVTSVGFGMIMGKHILVAADLVDVGNRAGLSEFRTGVELGVGGGLALRAGYNSRTAITLGASLFGFNFSFAGRQPLMVGSNIRF